MDRRAERADFLRKGVLDAQEVCLHGTGPGTASAEAPPLLAT
jgi:hypothetical protein